MFPFNDRLQSFNTSGIELLKMLKIIQSGERGFYQLKGIQTTATIINQKRQFVSAKMMDGT